jgi:hypothetical protein
MRRTRNRKIHHGVMAGLIPAMTPLVLSQGWMPGIAGKFTPPAQAWLRAGHDGC